MKLNELCIGRVSIMSNVFSLLCDGNCFDKAACRWRDVGGGRGRKGKGRQRQSGKHARPGFMNSFTLSRVTGTSSEPITAVTR